MVYELSGFNAVIVDRIGLKDPFEVVELWFLIVVIDPSNFGEDSTNVLVFGVEYKDFIAVLFSCYLNLFWWWLFEDVAFVFNDVSGFINCLGEGFGSLACLLKVEVLNCFLTTRFYLSFRAFCYGLILGSSWFEMNRLVDLLD